jgi:hypothetical protein
MVMVYLLTLLRRTNIVMKKVDYLVEDFTYKAEALQISVDAIQKISDYVLLADSFTKDGFESLFKLFTQNKNFFYELIDKIKGSEDTTTERSKIESSKKSTSKKKTSTTKKTTAKKTTTKKPAVKKTATKKSTNKKTTTKKK